MGIHSLNSNQQKASSKSLTCLTLNLIVHVKTMWFITSTKNPICKTFPRLSRCLIQVKAKTLQVYLSQFCDHSRLLLIVLHFQVININPY